MNIQERVDRFADEIGLPRERYEVKYDPHLEGSVHFPSFSYDDPARMIFGRNVNGEMGDYVIVHELMHEVHERDKFNRFDIERLSKEYVDNFRDGMMFNKREFAHQFLYEFFIDALTLQHIPELYDDWVHSYRCIERDTVPVCKRVVEISKRCKLREDNENCVEKGIKQMLDDGGFDVVFSMIRRKNRE